MFNIKISTDLFHSPLYYLTITKEIKKKINTLFL